MFRTVPSVTRSNPRRLFRAVLMLGSLALIAAACGGDDSTAGTSTIPPATTPSATTAPAPTAAPATTTTAAPTTTTVSTTTTTTEPPAPVLPDSPVVATLGGDPSMGYKVDMATFAALDFTAEELPAPPGTVEVRWYTHQDRYVLAFSGFDAAEAGPLCPGASILTDSGFEFVSNAPTAAGACEGFSTLTTDPLVEAKICGGTLFYATLISSDLQGTLFGSLEALAEPGVLIGMTSTAEVAGGAPEIDLGTICS